jgi:hypothetical protein
MRAPWTINLVTTNGDDNDDDDNDDNDGFYYFDEHPILSTFVPSLLN